MKGDGAIESGLTTCLDSRPAAWPYEIKSLIRSGGTGEVYQGTMDA